ncbi:MAG TPA: hypothetical protein DD670_19825 [Planctomycetaceae bacterium]|nr:hypothetical protein [Planctomycetaceae bacterium]
MPKKSKKVISKVFEEFLADQESRLSPRTVTKYRDILSLYESYLESYWPGQGEKDYRRITGKGGTFCGTYGPEEILDGYSEFLGYFMPHKVDCGKETMKAAGTVTKALAKWLAEKGYATDTAAAQERAKEAATNLPAAQDVLELLEQYVDEHSPHVYQQEIEDHFWIKKIESGKLWLEPLTGSGEVLGPVPVPREVTKICQEMWDIGGVVVKTSRGWKLREVWNVSP